MRKSTKITVSVVGTLLVLATVAAMVYSAMGSFEHLCEVCITYNGRTDCGEAWGATREEALRTATDNACALIAGGMTDTIRCTNTEPVRVTCDP